MGIKMIIESLRYLYVLLMNNELLKQHFTITQPQTFNIKTHRYLRKHPQDVMSKVNNKVSVNRGK